MGCNERTFKNKLSNDVDMSLVEKESYEYYKNALETGEHIAYLVYDNETFIGAGGGLAECLCEKRNGGAYSFSGGSGKAGCGLYSGAGMRCAS